MNSAMMHAEHLKTETQTQLPQHVMDDTVNHEFLRDCHREDTYKEEKPSREAAEIAKEEQLFLEQQQGQRDESKKPKPQRSTYDA